MNLPDLNDFSNLSPDIQKGYILYSLLLITIGLFTLIVCISWPPDTEPLNVAETFVENAGEKLFLIFLMWKKLDCIVLVFSHFSP